MGNNKQKSYVLLTIANTFSSCFEPVVGIA
jgi:hypothetical protein